MKYKKYPKYKDSGVEWIGEIPEGWEVNRLKFLCNITTGAKNTEDNESEGDYPFFVRSQKVEKISTYSCDEEAVLTAGDGVGVGKVFHYVNGKFDFHQRVYKMNDFKKILGKYFFHYFQENFKKEIFKGTAKSTVDSIRLHMIQDFPISFGPEEEQEQIIAFLKKQTTQFDELIAKSKTQITLLEEKKQATINQAVTKGLDLSVKMKDSGVDWIGEIPEEWEIQILKNFSSHVTKGATPTTYGFDWSDDENDIMFIRNECIQENNFTSKGSLRITKNAHNFLKRSKIIPGDILISITGEVGKSCIFPKNLYESNINQHIARINVNLERIEPKFLVNLLNSNKLKNYFNSIIHGLTHPHLNLEQVRNTKIILPPIHEQKKIGQYLEKHNGTLDKLIGKSKKQIIILEEKRQALITAAVTGKIDVRGEIAV